MNDTQRQWQYHVLRTEPPFSVQELDALGKEGWELVSVTADPGTPKVSLVFKRPAPDFRTRVTLDQRAAVAGGATETETFR
ncbi:MAG TPA: hypothetical protein VGR08_10395 [Thermomicrobiales bacterium]|nr:hypothetical protein [Thermomicrobiales bacterium]